MINQVEPWLTNKEKKLVNEYLSSGGWLTEFRETEKLEKIIADFLGVKYVVATTNGTVALTLSLMALGIGKGDEVIVPDFTMIATANVVKLVGASPIFADIEEDTLCLDVEKLPISKKTKAIMYVSLNGRSGNIKKIKKICRDSKLYLIEDACQAFASRYGNKYLGTFGDIGCFSMSPHKIITTGQGGILVTGRKDLFERIMRLKNFGRLSGGVDWHEAMGYNFKFTDLQAVIGIAQMSNIAERVRRKKKLFGLYRDELSGIGQIMFVPTEKETTPWFVDILVPIEKRNALVECLNEKGVATRPFYPSINSQPIYKKSKRRSFPVSEKISQQGLWLPSSALLKKKEVEYICAKVRNFFNDSNL